MKIQVTFSDDEKEQIGRQVAALLDLKTTGLGFKTSFGTKGYIGLGDLISDIVFQWERINDIKANPIAIAPPTKGKV